MTEWLPSYRRADLRPDLLAGATVAAVLVPQAMAYAQIAGLPPETGLYAATLPIVLYAVFGSSRQLAVGPVALISLMTAAALANTEPGVDPLAAAAALALLVAVAHLALGGLRLGWLSNFLSHAVLVGFTAAAAILIGVSQARRLLGVDIEPSERFVESATRIGDRLGEVHGPTLAVGVTAIVVLLAIRRLAPTLPGALVVVAGAIGVSELFDLEGKGVAVVGDIPDSLPGFGLPDVSSSLLVDLAPAAVAITLVGFLESIAVAKVAGRRHDHEPGPNHELVALGMANAGAGVFGGFPVTGSFSRTAVSSEAGARTQLASVVAATLVVATIALLTPVLSSLPLAVLAAVVIVAVIRLVDVAEIRRIARVKPIDMVSLTVAFAATLLLGVVVGISAGIVVSLLVALIELARPSVVVLGRRADSTSYRSVKRFDDADEVPGVRIVRVDAPLVFANTSWVKNVLVLEARTAADNGVHVLVVNCAGMNDVDSGGVAIFEEALDEIEAIGVELHLVDVKGPVREVFRRSGTWERLEGRLHYGIHEAVESVLGH